MFFTDGLPWVVLADEGGARLEYYVALNLQVIFEFVPPNQGIFHHHGPELSLHSLWAPLNNTDV